MKGQRCSVGTPYISGEVKKGLLTYGHKGSEKWSRTTIHQEVNGPIGGEQWSQHLSKYRHLSTDLSTSRNVTVHIQFQCQLNYGRIWSKLTVNANPHEKLLGILRVSNPATRKDLADRTLDGSGTNPKCRFCSR